MDTKLKDMSKKKGIILSVCWIMLLTFFGTMFAFYLASMNYDMSNYYFIRQWDNNGYDNTGYLIDGKYVVGKHIVVAPKAFFDYGETFMDISTTGMIVGMLFLALLITVSIFYLRKNPLKKSCNISRIDKWNLELEVIGLLILTAAISVVIAIFPITNYPFSFLYGWGIIKFVFLMLILSALFFGAILLLIRKKVLGLIKETSYILQLREKYIQRNSYEKRIENVYKRYFIAVLSLVLCLIIALLFLFHFWKYLNYYSYAIMMGVRIFAGLCCFAILILHIRYFRRNNILHDTGTLISRIHAMYEDVESEDQVSISEESLLYGASCELDNIRDAMQKSMEKQIQAERMKVDLITNVSHDLKTPLTSMIGYTDLLKKKDLDPEVKDYVDIISVKQKKLGDMIQDIFELSKATSNSEQLDMQILNMNVLVEQIMTDMEDALSKKDFAYVKRFAETPLYFYGDNSKMYRVVQNLLENTLKYTLDNTRVFVETSKTSDGICLTVKNIASYQMNFSSEEIAERFVRADESRSTEGHGLGLAIATSLLRNMNGSLQIDTDGDLFKATVLLPEAEPPSVIEE